MYLGKYIPGNPNLVAQNMYLAGLDDRDKLSLWAGQTGRIDHRYVPNLHVPATTGRSPRGEIRRAKIQLAQARKKEGR